MMRILIIDDDDETRGAIEQALRSGGYEVAAASDGKQGVELHRAQPVNLVITDLFMPDQEGLETIAEFRKNFSNVPIIAISGGYHASRPMLAVAQQLGAARVLEKPFDGDTLLAAVKELLR